MKYMIWQFGVRRWIALVMSLVLFPALGLWYVTAVASSRREVKPIAEVIAALKVRPGSVVPGWESHSRDDPGKSTVVWSSEKGERFLVSLTSFPSPLKAEIHYLLHDPTASQANDFDSHPVGADIPTVGQPDQDEGWCVIGDLSRCFSWLFWARYGQYILRVEAFATSFPLGFEAFASNVKIFASAFEAAVPANT
jgi:hypothetical protein